MSSTINIAFSSAGGYGYWYLKKALEKKVNHDFKIIAVFDPNIENSNIYKELKANDIACYSDYSNFLEALSVVDLAIIVSPIHFHSKQTIDALGRGCNVLLDKPLAGNLEQAKEVISVSKATGKWVMLGYQWSFSKAIRALKRDLLKGEYGRIITAKSLVFWPRGFDYYSRNNWVGKKTSHEGLAINDSLINNAMAHFIHNLLFLSGDDMESCAVPVKGKAEIYKAYSIETFDTAIIHLKMKNHIRIKMYASHVTKNAKGPLFIVECEKAVIYYGELSNDITAVQLDGKAKVYGDPEDTDQFEKFFTAIDACRSGNQPICSAEPALQQTRIVQALSEIGPAINFEKSIITEIEDDRLYVDGLGYMLFSSYQQGVMPSKKKFHIKGKINRFKIN